VCLYVCLLLSRAHFSRLSILSLIRVTKDKREDEWSVTGG
jgi:hypothetical protein